RLAGAARGEILECGVRRGAAALRCVPRRGSGDRAIPMSGFPLVVEGTAISAIVIGGGRVATRKVMSLLESGMKVHVIAPVILPPLEQLAAKNYDLRLTKAHFSLEMLGDSLLVVVATDDPEVNALVAAQARARGKLVNVVNAPDQGNC